MALALSSTRGCRHAARPMRTQSAVPRPRTVAVRAGFGDAVNNVFSAFVSIFTPPRDTIKDWKGISNTGYSGRIKRGRQPYADGVVRQKASGSAAQVAEDDNGVMDYVGGALRRVMGNNFKGDTTDPGTGTGAAGWKGDIHDRRKRDGFHKPSW